MHSKLFLAARTLARDQANDLFAFMKMPGNGLSENDRRMMKAFLSKMNTFSDGAEEEAFWEKQLKGAGKQKKHVRNRLLKALERFLSLQYLEQNPALRHTLLADFYTEQGVSKNASFYIGKARKEIRKRRHINLDEGLFEFLLYGLEAHRNKDKREHSYHLEQMEAALKDFYQINRMRLICEMASRRRIIREGHEILETAVAEYGEDAPQEFLVYHWQFKMVQEDDASAYRHLRDFMRENEDFFSPKYYKEFILVLMNFCIRYINRRQKQYAEDYLSYIELLEKKGHLLEGGYMPPHRFPNCIMAFILVGHMGRARAFFDAYGPKLLESKDLKSRPFLNFYRAILELFDGQAEEAWELLLAFQRSGMYLKDVYHKIASDKMLLMVFYQQKEFDSVLARIDSLRKYILENPKLERGRKELHFVFLKILRRLARRKETDWKKYEKELSPLDYLWLERFAARIPVSAPV